MARSAESIRGFLPREATEDLIAPLAGFELFKTSNRTQTFVFHLREIESRGRRVSVFNLANTIGSQLAGGEEWRVGVTDLQVAPLPYGYLRPRTFINRARAIFARRRVKLDGFPAFHERYIVTSDDPDRLRMLLRAPLLEHLAAQDAADIFLEMEGGLLMGYSEGALRSVQQQRFADRLAAIAILLDPR